MAVYHRMDLALDQLEGAIEAYFRLKFGRAITLGGAAEGIIGKFVAKAGGPRILDDVAASLMPSYDFATTKILINGLLNEARDALKHYDWESGRLNDTVDLDLERHAISMIYRAMNCFLWLHESSTSAYPEIPQYMHDFNHEVRTRRPELFQN